MSCARIDFGCGETLVVADLPDAGGEVRFGGELWARFEPAPASERVYCADVRTPPLEGVCSFATTFLPNEMEAQVRAPAPIEAAPWPRRSSLDK